MSSISGTMQQFIKSNGTSGNPSERLSRIRTDIYIQPEDFTSLFRKRRNKPLKNNNRIGKYIETILGEDSAVIPQDNKIETSNVKAIDQNIFKKNILKLKECCPGEGDQNSLARELFGEGKSYRLVTLQNENSSHFQIKDKSHVQICRPLSVDAMVVASSLKSVDPGSRSSVISLSIPDFPSNMVLFENQEIGFSEQEDVLYTLLRQYTDFNLKPTIAQNVPPFDLNPMEGEDEIIKASEDPKTNVDLHHFEQTQLMGPSEILSSSDSTLSQPSYEWKKSKMLKPRQVVSEIAMNQFRKKYAKQMGLLKRTLSNGLETVASANVMDQRVNNSKTTLLTGYKKCNSNAQSFINKADLFRTNALFIPIYVLLCAAGCFVLQHSLF